MAQQNKNINNDQIEQYEQATIEQVDGISGVGSFRPAQHEIGLKRRRESRVLQRHQSTVNTSVDQIEQPPSQSSANNPTQLGLNVTNQILVNADSPQTSNSPSAPNKNELFEPSSSGRKNDDNYDSDESSCASEDFDYVPVLTKILNEKKLQLVKLPEVVKFLGDITATRFN